MPRTAARFTQADIARALRGVRASGVKANVEVKPDGTIVIVPQDGKTETPPPAAQKPEREIIL
ncbi:hypothetical protein V5F40_02985 [Xanthobacter sp. DSM 14520]|uniref:hypothetical protein n=1 Tax=Xanthobacter autotrophicus (strain ATCC BAA-1158 / Py2) TaxID=78245 RepID=UPI0037284F74